MKRSGPRHWSLMTKLPLTITVMVFGSALIIGFLVIERDGARQAALLESQTLAMARAVAAAGEAAVLNKDVWSLYRTLDRLVDLNQPGASEASVIDAAFLDPRGIVLAHTDPVANPIGLPLAAGDEYSTAQLDHALSSETAYLVPPEIGRPGVIDAVVPIRVDETDVGFLVLRSSTRPMMAQLQRDSLLVLAFSLGLALITSTLGALISRRMVRPLRELSAGLNAVMRGDHEAVQAVPTVDHDEIGNLTVQFNRMVGELARNKRLEQELATAERLAGLGRFAAGLAHEVNNPLGGMKNCVNMLSRHPEDVQLVRKYLPLLDTGLNRISATIQALLGELRGESNAHPCQIGCLMDLEAMVKAEIGDRPVDLEWRIGAADLAGLSLNCTCPHVHQIVLNLARNAIAVMAGGGRLRVSSRREGQELAIEIADNGPGLDVAAQRQLFEPFYTTSQEGTGLGLWITYNLIRRMGGRISVDSVPGDGARFTVKLPLVKTLAIVEKDSDRAA